MYYNGYHPSNTAGLLIAIIVLWSLAWKLYAVWLAAKRDQKRWFLALLLLNTASILELIYVFKIVKKSWEDVKQDFRHAWASVKKRS